VRIAVAAVDLVDVHTRVGILHHVGFIPPVQESNGVTTAADRER
jgi:hypothetical protein